MFGNTGVLSPSCFFPCKSREAKRLSITWRQVYFFLGGAQEVVKIEKREAPKHPWNFLMLKTFHSEHDFEKNHFNGMVEWTRVISRYDHEYPPSLPHDIFFRLVNILTKSLLLNEDLDPELGAYHILKNHQMSGDSAKITEKGAKARNSFHVQWRLFYR